MEVRDEIQKLAVQMPAYGYRRITAVLQQAGWEVNHKRVLRLMRADNLLCLRKRAFVRTTDSDHALRIYPNLARELKPSGLNQLWCCYYLHSLARIRVSGSDSGCVFTPGDWVGVGPHVRGEVGLEALQIAIGRASHVRARIAGCSTRQRITSNCLLYTAF